jgi:hypothetical protein
MKNIFKAIILLFACSLLFSPHALGQWQVGGIQISGDNYWTGDVTAISDGQTGMFVAWKYYPQQYNPDIYVQHLDSAGYELWPHEGIQACIEPYGQYAPQLALDDSGGMFVIWTDLGRDGAGNPNIYAQRMGPSGERLWGELGLPIILHDGEQSFPLVVADGAGGAIIYWTDSYPPDTVCVVAQRIDGQGNLLYGPYGMRLTVPRIDGQSISGLVRSSDGYFIACWYDHRTDGAGPGIYAQKFTIPGELLWGQNGIPTIISSNIDEMKYAASPNGGFYALWTGTYARGAFLQWVDGAGAARLGPGGMSLTDEWYCNSPHVITGFDGRAIVCWQNQLGTDRITANIIDTSGVQQWWGNLTIAENVYSLNSLTQSIPGEFEFCGRKGAPEHDLRAFKYSAAQGLIWGDSGVRIGPSGGWAGLGVTDMVGGSFFVWQPLQYDPIRVNRVYRDGWVVAVAGDDNGIPSRLSLHPYPNPFNSSVIIRISGNSVYDGYIDIFDVKGSLVDRVKIEGDKVNWNVTGRSQPGIASGIYFAQLRSGKEVVSTKLLYIR